MADTKISDLADGTTPDDADVFPAARAGTNVKLSWAELIAAAVVPPASALATHEADTTNIHGIANTAVLETTTGAQAKADAAQAASQPVDSDLTAIAALTTTSYGRSLLALADAAAARTALALGTAATAATGDFDAAGAASAAQAASQPVDSDLSAIAALTTTSYGRAFLALADAAAGRMALGLGTLATQSGTFSGTSSGTNTGDQTVPALATPAVTLGVAAAAGAASTTIRSDGTIAAFDATVPSTQAFADAAAVGVAAFAARRDHSHAMPANPVGISWTVVTKSADQDVSANTTVANDTHLFFTATSGALYEIEVSLIYASPLSAGTPDFKIALGEDNTIRGGFNVQGGLTVADAVATAALQSQQNAVATYGTAAANRIVVLRGSHAGAGGTFRLLWSQNTSDANPTTVRAGSLMRYRRIL